MQEGNGFIAVPVLAIFVGILWALVKKRVAKRWIAVFGIVYFIAMGVINDNFYELGWVLFSIFIITFVSIAYLFAKGKEYKNGVL